MSRDLCLCFFSVIHPFPSHCPVISLFYETCVAPYRKTLAFSHSVCYNVKRFRSIQFIQFFHTVLVWSAKLKILMVEVLFYQYMKCLEAVLLTVRPIWEVYLPWQRKEPQTATVWAMDFFACGCWSTADLTAIGSTGRKTCFSLVAILLRRKQTSGYSGVGTAPHLGCGDRAFESHYSDQPVLTKKMQAKIPHFCAGFLHIKSVFCSKTR